MQKVLCTIPGPLLSTYLASTLLTWFYHAPILSFPDFITFLPDYPLKCYKLQCRSTVLKLFSDTFISYLLFSSWYYDPRGHNRHPPKFSQGLLPETPRVLFKILPTISIGTFLRTSLGIVSEIHSEFLKEVVPGSF